MGQASEKELDDGNNIVVRRQWLEELAINLRQATSQVGFPHSRDVGLSSLRRLADAVASVAIAKTVESEGM